MLLLAVSAGPKPGRARTATARRATGGGIVAGLGSLKDEQEEEETWRSKKGVAQARN